MANARDTLAGDQPQKAIGPHCSTPYNCHFYSHCEKPRSEYPITILPRGGKRMWKLYAEGFRDLRDVPEDRLATEIQLKVWRATKTGIPEVSEDLRRHLSSLEYPRHYLDFETLWLAIPFWAGTRPYEQVPFQWSCHREERPGELTHSEFLAAGTEFPARAFAESLLRALGSQGLVIAYGNFEKTVLASLAKRFPDLEADINAVIGRIEDLLTLMRAHYYHPAMAGEWSIKAVLPTVCPDLSYACVIRSMPVTDSGVVR